MEGISVRLGFDNCFVVDALGRSGGLALFWQKRWDLAIVAYSNYHIDAWLNKSICNTRWRLTYFYREPHTHLHNRFWSFMKQKHNPQSSVEPWLCLGDWNEILQPSEKQRGTLCNLAQIQRF